MDTIISKLTDDELVGRYAGGDNNAFGTLLARHEKKIFGYILFYVHDDDTANDIFQDTFIRAIDVIRNGKYKATGKFFQFLCRIAHNLIIDHFRNTQNDSYTTKNDFIDNIDSDFEEGGHQLTEDNVEDKIIEAQILEDVKKLLMHLPEEQQRIVRMRFYEELSFKEIAENENISINTALGRMRYAIINMRNMVEKEDIKLTV